MALLTDAQKSRAFRQMVDGFQAAGPVPGGKSDLAGAIVAANQWVDDNAASFNAALPVEFRTGAVAARKNELLQIVLAQKIR